MISMRSSIISLAVGLSFLPHLGAEGDSAESIDYVVKEVQPSGATDSVFDIIVTVRRIFSDSKMLLFHKDHEICYGVLRLNNDGEHLIVVDPRELHHLKISIDGRPAHLRNFVIKANGMSWTREGKWIENDLVAECHVGFVVKIADDESFSFNSHVPKAGRQGGFELHLSRSNSGDWKSTATLESTDNASSRVNCSKVNPRANQ